MRIFILFLFAVNTYADINGYVVDVPQADTIVVLKEGVKHRILLKNIYIIDAYKQVAKKDIVTLCLHKKASIKDFQQDNLGRKVGIIFCDSIDIKKKIIYDGFALTYKKDKRYAKQMQDAQINKRGIWKREELLKQYGYSKFQR